MKYVECNNLVSLWNVCWFDQVEGEVESAAFRTARILNVETRTATSCLHRFAWMRRVRCITHRLWVKGLCFACLPLAYDRWSPLSVKLALKDTRLVLLIVCSGSHGRGIDVLSASTCVRLQSQMQAYTSSLAIARSIPVLWEPRLAPWLRNL